MGKEKVRIVEMLKIKEKWKLKGRLLEFQDKIGAVVFLLVSIMMFLLFYVHSKDSFIGISGEKEPAKELPLEQGMSIEQEFLGDGTEVMGISICFRTYGNKNGNIHVRLHENGQVLEEWDIAAEELENNSYHSFPFRALRKIKRDVSYKLSITGESEGEQGVSVWLTKEQGGDCYANGKLLGQYALCWQNTYVALTLKRWVRLIAALLFLAVGLAVLRKADEEALMSGILVALGAIYFWMCPLGMAPDETNHFFRAYEISCGEWSSRHMGEDGGGGNYLPAALQEYGNPSAEIDTEEIAELRYGNTSLYAPVSYLPQTVGIRIARVFTRNVSKIFYAGRFGNFLASMLLCLCAIHLMPFGKRVLFLVMMFPMSMQEMVSMAPDGFTIALTMAFLAYIFRLRCREEKLGNKEMALVGLMGIVIALCKIVYVVLLLLVFMLPKEKFREKKQAMLFHFGIPSAAFAMNLIWLKISSGYLIEFTPGVSSGEQVKYVLTHLSSYFVTVIDSVQAGAKDWVLMMIGCSLGALNIGITRIVCDIFWIMLIYEVCNCRQIGWRARRRDWLVLAFIFFSGSALIITSLYVQWTALASPMVSGVQGRYFTPLLPSLAMSIVCAAQVREQGSGEIKNCQMSGSYYYMLLLMLHGIAILDVIHHYI